MYLGSKDERVSCTTEELSGNGTAIGLKIIIPDYANRPALGLCEQLLRQLPKHPGISHTQQVCALSELAKWLRPKAEFLRVSQWLAYICK